MKWCLLILSFCVVSIKGNAQADALQEKEAGTLLQTMGKRYSSYRTIQASFTLSAAKPKAKVTDDESKLTQVAQGSVTIMGKSFYIQLPGQKIWCNGKTIWTLNSKSKEVQIETFEPSSALFNPSELFTFYTKGFMYRTREKRKMNGQNQTIVELSPTNKQVSYFKIELTIQDEPEPVIREAKIFEKSGVRYGYKINTLETDVSKKESDFTFNPKSYPGYKTIDLQ